MGDQPRRPRPVDDRPPRRRPPGPTTPPSGLEHSAPRPSTSRPLVIGLSVLGVVAVIAVVLVVIGSGGGSGVQNPGTPTTATGVGGTGTGSTVPGTGTTLPEGELTTYVDDDAGFSLKYPKSWSRFQSTDPDVHLVAAAASVDDGPAGNGLVVRMFRSEVATTSENLANVQAFTDGVVGSNPTARVLQRRVININGMPGYFYLYTFTDEITGREGAHGHYFLFRGTKVNQLILQAVPTEGYERLSAVFDQIGESFKSEPDTAPAATAPTTTVAP